MLVSPGLSRGLLLAAGGPTFRPRHNSRGREPKLAERHFTPTAMYNLIAGYLAHEFRSGPGTVRLGSQEGVDITV
jgi:hypothetical protein